MPHRERSLGEPTGAFERGQHAVVVPPYHEGVNIFYDAIRTPRGRGKKTGSLHGVKPISLVVGLIDELRRRHPNLDADRISDIVLGVVSPIGDQGMDIAKTAAIRAGLPDTVGGVQLNRFCASGLEAVNMAAQKVRSGWDELVVGGGVESMSRVAMGSDGGAWAMDPETNYETYFIPQGISADLIATIEGFSREDVDPYALESQTRAAKAWSGGYFAKSVIPVTDRNGLVILDHDEHMRPDTDMAGLAKLKTAVDGIGAMGGFDAALGAGSPGVGGDDLALDPLAEGGAADHGKFCEVRQASKLSRKSCVRFKRSLNPIWKLTTCLMYLMFGPRL